jgi:hypothetical protein
MLNFGALAFASPWILLGLLALPVIWWLLRVTPPAPRRERFPPVRILMSLRPTEETPARTPLWLTILRLALAALAVLALADPVLNPAGRLPGDGPIVLAVDDGWAAAAHWEARVAALEGLLDRAEREGRPVMLLPTAPATDGSAATLRLARAAELRSALPSLQPKPWAIDRVAALAALGRFSFEAEPSFVWLSDGLDEGSAEAFADRLAALGELTVMEPAPAERAKALLPPEATPDGLEAPVLRVADPEPDRTWVRISGDGGRLLARAEAEFPPGEGRAVAHLELPADLRNQALRLDVESQQSAGAAVLMDERWRRRPVGLVSGASAEERAQPLLSDLYYLERALAPYADIRQGDVQHLVAQPLSILALADVGKLAPLEQRALEDWIRDGGVLIRFAGPRLAQNADELIPVRLRAGGRELGGALSWSQPARLAPFPENSPFAGLPVTDEVVVHRQVLAEPSLDLNEKTWARLADGTPLVTAERRGHGWLVLFHTTANADWSNLSLSGLFVEMLRRIVALSRGVATQESTRPQPPLASLDGRGRLGAPSPYALPLPPRASGPVAVGPRHPPGFYGTDEARTALNLAAGWTELRAAPQPPPTAARAAYAARGETQLKPWLLSLAVALTLIDLVAVLALRGLLPGRRAARAAALLPLLVLLAPPDADAQADRVMEATLETHLAYVLTGDPEVDRMSQAGLFGLSEVLRQRTSVEPAEPLPVDIERDEVLVFPLLYWPITPTQKALSDAAVQRVTTFMRTGGTILFDTRDAGAGPSYGSQAGGENAQALRRLLSRVDMPPLSPIPPEHVLTKSFYLMQSFPGRYDRGRVWVELRPDGLNDGVSPVIIGGNDWAAAWATDEQGRPLAAVVPGGNQQREMAWRFGVNVVMYVLTGNYKADQVHVPAILERLGQ